MNSNWKQLASKAIAGPLDPQRLAGANKDRIEGMLAALDFLAERHDLTKPSGANNSSNADSTEPQEHPAVKVSVYMKQENGSMTGSQSLELSVDTTKSPVPVTLKVCGLLLLVFCSVLLSAARCEHSSSAAVDVTAKQADSKLCHGCTPPVATKLLEFMETSVQQSIKSCE